MYSGLCKQNKQDLDIDSQLNHQKSEIRMLAIQRNEYKRKYERLCRNSSRKDLQMELSTLQTENLKIKEQNEHLQSNVLILKQELVTNEKKLRKVIQNTQKVFGMMERDIYRLKRLHSNTETELQDIKRTICHSQPNMQMENSIVESFVLIEVAEEQQK